MFHVKHPKSETCIASVPRGPAGCSGCLTTLPSAVKSRLAVFERTLLDWARRIDLVAPGDLSTLNQRHVQDSLQLIPLIPPECRTAVDLGSGAGFPGLILAIATGLHFHLIDSDRRKCAFLLEAARLTEAPVTIHPQRIERVTPFPADLITARALAALPTLLTLASPFLHPATTCLFPRGHARARQTPAIPGWDFGLDHIPSATHPESVILRLRQISRVPG